MNMISFLKKHLQNIKQVKAEIEEEERLDMLVEDEPEDGEAEKESFWEKIRQHRSSARKRWIILIAAMCLLVIGGLLFLYVHVGTDYTTISKTKRTDISSTAYAEFGDNLIKYSSDGVSCVKDDGSVLWSSTFSMQSPIIDICKTTATVADQKGTQIYVFNEKGLLGQFQTSLPIEKVRVASQGVVSAVLNDGDITWINFYDTKGNEIAKNRASLGDSGYPLDMAISPDGLKIMVSYLRVTQGIMNTKICFYNFDSVGQTEINNMVSSKTHENAVAPEVIFADEETAAAIRSNGFSIFKGRQIPELGAEVEFEEEILSVFHNSKNLGFIFQSDEAEYKYRMQLYDMNGKQAMKVYFNLDYKQVKVSDGNIILFNDKAFEIYNTGGRKRFSGTFKKPIQDIIKVKGFRKYLVFAQDSTYLIRLK